MRKIDYLNAALNPENRLSFWIKLGSIALLLLSAYASKGQHRAVVWGHPGKNDQCHKLIRTNDGSYLVVGMVNNNAALYKFDCAGQIIDSLQYDLPADDSFEEFLDAVEMPNGDFIAVGGLSVLLKYSRALVARVNANLQIIKVDTVPILNRAGTIRQIIRTKSGNIYVGGSRTGAGFDFTDGFVATLDPATLQTKDSVCVYSYGIDIPTSLMQTLDGNLLMTGYSVTGNIFSAESVLNNTAWIKKIDLNGTQKWDYKHSGAFKAKFGTMFFANVAENPIDGSLLAAGNIFSGDTTQNNILDLHYVLLSQSGTFLDKITVPKPGSQNLHRVINFPVQTGLLQLAIGDSTASVPGPLVAPMFSIVSVAANKIVHFGSNSDQTAPILSIKGAVAVPNERFAFAGVLFDPNEPADRQKDLLIALPSFEIKTEIVNYTATVTQPSGPGYEFFWLKDNVLVSQDKSVAPGVTTEYVLIIRDPQGCINAVLVKVEIPPLTATATVTNVTCFGGKDGQITLKAAGGVPPYTYGSSADPVLKNLFPGNYTIDVVDSRNNEFTIKATVVSPPPFSNVTATASQNKITVTLNGGTPPYQYSLNGSTFQNSNVFNNLANGTYKVTVRDANGCTTVSNEVIINFVGTDELIAAWGIRLSPNPATSVCWIAAEQLPAGEWMAQISDESGRALQNLSWGQREGTLREQIDLSLLPAGLYHLSLSNGDKKLVLAIGKL